MHDILKCLENEGCNIQDGLHRLMDDEEFYVSCVEEFLHDPYFARLKENLEQGDLSAAFDSAHTLKGVASNLSLSPLYDAVCTVVEILRTDSDKGAMESYATIIQVRDHLLKAFA